MNKFEKKLYIQLKRKKKKVEFESVSIPYVIEANYYPDLIIDTDKGLVYIEAKGYLRPEHKRKMVAVKKQHPDLDIRFIFYRYRKEDVKWATKYGFPYAIDKIPTEWIKEL